MSRKKDDWPRNRGRGDHFTQAELDLISQRFHAGVPASTTARELLCSTRNIQIRYAQMRGNPRLVIHKLPDRPRRPPADRGARFYRSDFQPS